MKKSTKQFRPAELGGLPSSYFPIEVDFNKVWDMANKAFQQKTIRGISFDTIESYIPKDKMPSLEDDLGLKMLGKALVYNINEKLKEIQKNKE